MRGSLSRLAAHVGRAAAATAQGGLAGPSGRPFANAAAAARATAKKTDRGVESSSSCSTSGGSAHPLLSHPDTDPRAVAPLASAEARASCMARAHFRRVVAFDLAAQLPVRGCHDVPEIGTVALNVSRTRAMQDPKASDGPPPPPPPSPPPPPPPPRYIALSPAQISRLLSLNPPHPPLKPPHPPPRPPTTRSSSSSPERPSASLPAAPLRCVTPDRSRRGEVSGCSRARGGTRLLLVSLSLSLSLFLSLSLSLSPFDSHSPPPPPRCPHRRCHPPRPPTRRPPLPLSVAERDPPGAAP